MSAKNILETLNRETPIIYQRKTLNRVIKEIEQSDIPGYNLVKTDKKLGSWHIPHYQLVTTKKGKAGRSENIKASIIAVLAYYYEPEHQRYRDCDEAQKPGHIFNHLQALKNEFRL